jgi:SAM-dependent methyltransferase
VKSLKDLLANVSAYVAVQHVLGGDLLRYRCLEVADVHAGEVVVDVGCGPAYYFDRLPGPITYHGYDTDQRYLDWATKKYGDRGSFHCGIFDEAAAAAIPQPQLILLLGLLHHLCDTECQDLLELCGRVLAPGGRAVSVDPCFVPGQGRISRWMSENDRGEHVRDTDAFLAMASAEFDQVSTRLISSEGRIPGAHWLMRMSAPRAATPAQPE